MNKWKKINKSLYRKQVNGVTMEVCEFSEESSLTGTIWRGYVENEKATNRYGVHRERETAAEAKRDCASYLKRISRIVDMSRGTR